MIPATILPEAEVELREAVEYYEGKSPALGLDFAGEVEESLSTIRAFPERWPLRDDGTRRFLLRRFPYLIIYLHAQDRIWVIAVAHCKRRPDYWKDRIPGTEEIDEGGK